ncbi:MAG: aldo/keto reductase [Halioglobus sp.]
MGWMRPLGATGLRVSALGLGTVKLGRNTGVRYPRPFDLPDDALARSLLDTARDGGINLLDTAPAYGCSEERLGQLLKGQRDDWLICSKVGERYDAHGSRFDFSPEHARASVCASLKRLATAVIDIVLVHSDGNDLDIIERLGTLQALAELKQEGLLRAYGISTKTLQGGLRAAACCDVVMLTLNLEQREQAAVAEACAAAGTGVLVKKPLASGHLPRGDESRFLHNSMRLVLGQQGVSAALVGTLSPSHLRSDIAAARDVLA